MTRPPSLVVDGAVCWCSSGAPAWPPSPSQPPSRSDPPSQARAGEDETALGSDADEQAATTVAAEPTTTTAESTSTTPEATTTTSPESDTAGRTTSSGSGLDPEDPPDIVTTVPEPTTTTAAPPPWVANHIVLSSVFPPMEDRHVSFSITGAGDWIDIDYGDGSPSERLPAFGCDLWLSPAAPEHALPGPGTYTVTVRVRGSGVCATPRSSYRETVATYQLEVG